jgi:hypothetical protein
MVYKNYSRFSGWKSGFAFFFTGFGRLALQRSVPMHKQMTPMDTKTSPAISPQPPEPNNSRASGLVFNSYTAQMIREIPLGKKITPGLLSSASLASQHKGLA